MMILAALGADEDLIIKDFLLTNAVYEAEPDMDGAGPVEEDNIRLAISWMKENYGSILGYVTDGLGVTEEEIETLRARCLE
jgi:protein tyrosine/serine phosphatase